MKNIFALGLPGGSELMFILFFILIPFLFILLALVDILRSEFTEPNNKIIWVIVVLLLPLLGSLLYFLIGRNQKA
jgi:hypothetical protein